jgi:hydroxylamine reductase
MFCYQCEQTAKGQGCDRYGVCGKDPVSATLQDSLLFLLKGIAWYAARMGGAAMTDRETGKFVIEGLFTTVTNVDFDPDRLEALVRDAAVIRDSLAAASGIPASRCETHLPLNPAGWVLPPDRETLLAEAAAFSIPARQQKNGVQETGLEELITQGLKGAAAYADHALVLGYEDPEVFRFDIEALDFLTGPHTTPELLGMALKVGAHNFRVMELLDAANTGTYGHPVPTPVRITARKGHAILVSGHDLLDLHHLLEQTAGRGINVYTHGEMLPTHGYPGLNKYPHLAGNYGGAWQDQQKEFDAFPGAILMTTNCIQKPQAGYMDRIFTTGLVAWPGVRHVSREDFSPVIEAAMKAPGFAADEPEKTILVGFGRNAVIGVAPAVIEAVKGGAIRHFFLIGGCDGAKPGRNYYTELAEKVPSDCVILTLACGKFRFNKMDFGNIGGIPRLLDVGQCNDAYSAIRIALALSEAFGLDVNELPLSLVLSWYEQKAAAILLTLLHLGIRNIRLGPTLPACLTPEVVGVLHEGFNIMPVTTPDEDLRAILG